MAQDSHTENTSATLAPDDDHDRRSAAGRAAGYWQPGARLGGRTPASNTPRRSGGGSGLVIGTLIVATAVVLAIGIWLAARWSQAEDEPPEPVVAALITQTLR